MLRAATGTAGSGSLATVSYVLAKTNISVGIAPTGTMANNGAVTMGTALQKVYTNCYMNFPAGAIAAGVPATADTYFVQMSSTTVGTVFNNLLSANLDSFGFPVIPASPTAFATTGPGAFTGNTSAVALLTLTLPASSQGINGIFDLDVVSRFNNAATNKNLSITFGGTSLWTGNLASNVGHRVMAMVANIGSASVQEAYSYAITTAGTVLAATLTDAAINTGNAVSVVLSLTHGTATDTANIDLVTMKVTK